MIVSASPEERNGQTLTREEAPPRRDRAAPATSGVRARRQRRATRPGSQTVRRGKPGPARSAREHGTTARPWCPVAPAISRAVEIKPRVAGRASGLTAMWCAGVGGWPGARGGGSSRDAVRASPSNARATTRSGSRLRRFSPPGSGSMLNSRARSRAKRSERARRAGRAEAAAERQRAAAELDLPMERGKVLFP